MAGVLSALVQEIMISAMRKCAFHLYKVLSTFKKKKKKYKVWWSSECNRMLQCAPLVSCVCVFSDIFVVARLMVS